MINMLLETRPALPAVPKSTVQQSKHMEVEVHIEHDYGRPGNGYEICECISLDRIEIRGRPEDYMLPRYLWTVTRRHVDPDTGDEWDRIEHYEHQNEAVRCVVLMVNDVVNEAFDHGHSAKVEVHYVQQVDASEALDRAYAVALGLVEGCRTFFHQPDEDGESQPTTEEV